MTPRIEVFQDKAGQWRFRVIAANGEIVAQSEAYTSKHNACHGVTAMTNTVHEVMKSGSDTLITFANE